MPMERSRPVSLAIRPSVCRAAHWSSCTRTSMAACRSRPTTASLAGSRTAPPQGSTALLYSPATSTATTDRDLLPAGALRPGASVDVTRADGSTAHFTVDRVERYPKNAFPSVEVYGDTTHRSELRLITCGGSFDAASGHYRDNIFAYAHLL